LNSLDGSGVTIGILSDSYNCYATYASNGVPASGAAGYASNGFTATASDDVASKDLPASVNILSEASCMNYGAPKQLPFGDEGRAMMQIVHDVAPGAGLAFHTAENGEADFANGIQALASAGAQIIADDVGYFDEPFYQDGLIAQAIDTVQAGGVTYFSAAGNNADLAYENTAPAFGTVQASGVNAGEQLLNFAPSGQTASTTLPVSVPGMSPGEFVAIVLEWDDPYVTGAASSGGATRTLDLCVENASGTDTITDDLLNTLSTGCTGVNSLGSDPVQVIIVGNPANASGNTGTETFNIVVGLKSGSAPLRVKVAVEDDGLGAQITSYATHSATIQGHPSAAGAAAVGAAFYNDTPACGSTPASVELFSSEGGSPILFDKNGVRLATAQRRAKPDFVGPDGGNDTFLGFTLASATPPITVNTSITGCKNDASYPNFFGTSAATPHVAAVAALLLQADPSLTPSAVVSALSQSALPMADGAAFDGAGFVQADAAASQIPAISPAAPTLSLSASSIEVGQSSTLTWSSVNTTGCTASNAWTGSLAQNGTQTETPSSAGSYTYMLVCANAAGNSPSASVTLTVTAVPSSGGGGHGGGLDAWLLAPLVLITLLRARKGAAPKAV
jgi:hypothetical protein